MEGNEFGLLCKHRRWLNKRRKFCSFFSPFIFLLGTSFHVPFFSRFAILYISLKTMTLLNEFQGKRVAPSDTNDTIQLNFPLTDVSNISSILQMKSCNRGCRFALLEIIENMLRRSYGEGSLCAGCSECWV